MIGYNSYGSLGWYICETLKGLSNSRDPEHRGYLQGSVIVYVLQHVHAEDSEKSYEEREKEVDRLRWLVENVRQSSKKHEYYIKD